MTSKTFVARLILGVATLAVPALSQNAAAADGYYTQQQADDGKIKFNNHCATCHRPNLKGGLGPALIGDPFVEKWTDQPVSGLYDYIHSAMPQTAPGSLPPDQLNPIVAFILSKNGFPAGDTELSQDTTSADLKKP
jgi:mono/diheme cytochrome c family protein